MNKGGVKKQIKYYFLIFKRFTSLLIRTDPEKIAFKTINFGLIVSGIFLSIFLMWGVIAPINSASIASGKVVLDFNRKTISHLEGGIIEEILVKEGQSVVTGQPLVILTDIQIGSQNKMLKKQLITNLAVEEKLVASRDKREPDFSEITKQYGNKDFDIARIIDTQKNLFISWQENKGNKIAILNKKIAGLKDEIGGIISQKKAINKELKVLYRQEKMSKKLVESNNSPLNKLLEIEKKIAASEGKGGELKANIAKANQSIASTELEIENFKNERLNEVLSKLQEVESKISDLTEKLISTSDILKRTTIKSPTSGIVTNLKYHTLGAVISPASEVMYIVPKDDELIIEARINPNDIDNVEAGLIAKVQLTAFKAKKVPKLNGKVSSVSADILFDEITGEQYFLARIKIDDAEIKKLKSNIKLYPGMPAQTFIVIGSRSLFSYLFAPISEASYKAFREE